MSVPKKKAVVSRKVSDQQIIDARRWNDFIKASGVPFSELTEEWKDFFDAQSDTATASFKLVKLLDIAAEHDMLARTKQ